MFAADPGVPSLLALQGQGLQWDAKETRELLGSSACSDQQDRGSSVWTEEQGNAKSFAEVVRVKLRGRLWASALL